MVLALRFEQARIGALALDHVLDAARYAGFRAPVVFHLAGDPAAADPAALALLAGRGRVVVDPAAAARLGPAAAILFEDAAPRVAALDALLAAPHLLAWFAALPATVPAGRVATRIGACHLGALALDGAPPDGARLAALAAAFPGFLLLEDAPSRLSAAVARASGAGRASVPLLWRGEDSRLLAALRGGAPGPVALLAEDPAAPALLPLVAFITATLGRELRIFAGNGATRLPDWPAAGPLAPRPGGVSLAPLPAFLDPASWAGTRPAFVVEHGRPAACQPARELCLRTGIAHLRVEDPGAPEVIATAPALAYRARGFVSAALALAALHRQDGAPPHQAAAAEEFGRDAGWARIWGELGRLLAA